MNSPDPADGSRTWHSPWRRCSTLERSASRWILGVKKIPFDLR